MNTDDTTTPPESSTGPDADKPQPTLLVAYSPPGVTESDHVVISGEASATFMVGRGHASDFILMDNSISRRHIRLNVNEERQQTVLEDLLSKNGTYVNSRPVKGSAVLPDEAVIRAGRVLPVFRKDKPTQGQQLSDIPSLFDRLLDEAFARVGVHAPPTGEMLREEHYESLMLDGFEDDLVVGITGLVDAIASKAAAGVTCREAVGEVFSERYRKEYKVEPMGEGDLGEVGRITNEMPQPDFASTDHVQLVRDAHTKFEGDLQAIENHLRSSGVHYSKRRIAHIIEELETAEDGEGSNWKLDSHF